MISAILLDKDNEPLMWIKQINNFFVSDRAFDYSVGELIVSLQNRRQNNVLYKTRIIFVFGEGMNRHFVVTKVTTDNTQVFPKATFDLAGVEYLLNQRNEQDKEITWENVSPLDMCADLVGRIQSVEERRFAQLTLEAATDGEMDTIEKVQMFGGNVWDYISDYMESYKFCCDAITTELGVSKLIFRFPQNQDGVILSDLDRRVKLEYINLDYEPIRTYVIAGGEGEGIRKKYASFDGGETGLDRFEEYADVSISSNDGYISNDDYNKLLKEAAESMRVEKKLETDYIVPAVLYDRLKTGDTVYTSSAAVNEGLLEERTISELKINITNGVTNRYVTLI